MKTATIILYASGKKHVYRVQYDSLESLAESVWELSFIPNREFDTTEIILGDEETYLWAENYAHYCFAKGRLSVEDFVNFQFSKEFAA